MSRSPLVSVIMPVYNAAETIEEAVQSLLQQTYSDLEIIVVDDGSTDASISLIERYHDPRIRIVRQEHCGIVRTRNTGCAQARGTYLAVMDSDDVAHEGRIAAQVKFLERQPDVGLLGTHARFVHDDGREWLFTPPVEDRALRRYLLWDNPFVHSSVMFRRQAFEETGGYTEGIVANEDYRLWIRMARNWRLGMIPQVLLTYRVRGTSASRAASRQSALLARFGAQWEAAKMLGPWYQALPALGITGAAYLLSRTGRLLDLSVWNPARRLRSRRRGFRESDLEDR
ncbi:MAG: glycosyltransferase [Armatimonadota bacterium]|nr:glycosyltransferase [Armatimonadota bacterium]